MSTNELTDTTLEYAEELTDAILGLDRVYRDESGDEVGLAVLDLSDGREPAAFDGYADADARFAALRDRADSLAEPDREIYYRQFCESMLAFVEWRQNGLNLESQIKRFLHVPAEPPSDAELDGLLEEIGGVLGDLGYEGSVEERCTAWKEDTLVATNDAGPYLDNVMSEMRDRTLSTLNLPGELVDTIGARGVQDAAFNAKCDFANGEVVINTDPGLTKPWLRKLAVHEGYPGHVLQFSLRREWYEAGEAPADGLLSVVNCASSATFEGIADSGLALLDGGDRADEAASLVGRYQAGIATAGAWRYHAEGWSDAELGDWLADRAVYGDEEWARSRVKFVAAPERATLMWSYWHGEPAVRAVMDEVSDNECDAFVRFLYGRMHSPDSLAEFSA